MCAASPMSAGSQGLNDARNSAYLAGIASKVNGSRSTFRELAFGWQKGNLALVQQRLSFSTNTKIGPGTIAAALAALSMAVLGHFFI